MELVPFVHYVIYVAVEGINILTIVVVKLSSEWYKFYLEAMQIAAKGGGLRNHIKVVSISSFLKSI